MSEIIKPIPDGKPTGWKLSVQSTAEGQPQEIKAAAATLEQTKMGIQIKYGIGPEGYDRAVIQEPNGGGSVTVPYLVIDGETYIGVNRVGRSAAGGSVLEVPRGFSFPKESHQATAEREFTEETGVKKPLGERVVELSGKKINPNTTWFVADHRKKEGVGIFGIKFIDSEVELAHKSEDPTKKVYKFSEDTQGDIRENNERINPKGIRFFHADLLANTNDGFTLNAITRVRASLAKEKSSK